MNQVKCLSCEWEGRIIDLISFPKSKHAKQLCPECGDTNIDDCDGVSEQDYREDNPIERVVE